MVGSNKASNAVLAKARALYGRHLTGDDYRRLASCHSMPELAQEIKKLPLYQGALDGVNPTFARRSQLEAQLRQSIFEQYGSLCRFDMSAGSDLYRYFVLCCDLDEITVCLRCLDAGNPGDYLYRLPEFLQQKSMVDLYQLPKVSSAEDLLNALKGTPYYKVLLPLRQADPGKSLLMQAEPLMQDYRHSALVSLVPKAKRGRISTSQPGVREYIQLDCDVTALSNAIRLKHIHATPAQIDKAARRDMSALSAAQWEKLLDCEDMESFLQQLKKTVYGPVLEKYVDGYFKQRMMCYQYDWCRKWLRFSTDPTMVMLCYVYLARCEVTNLNRIIEGVHYGMPADDIMHLLIGCEA